MQDLLSTEGVSELTILIAVTFCLSIEWVELVQTMVFLFENGTRMQVFVGDKPTVRDLIEKAAEMRGLAIVPAHT